MGVAGAGSWRGMRGATVASAHIRKIEMPASSGRRRRRIAASVPRPISASTPTAGSATATMSSGPPIQRTPNQSHGAAITQMTRNTRVAGPVEDR